MVIHDSSSAFGRSFLFSILAALLVAFTSPAHAGKPAPPSPQVTDADIAWGQKLCREADALLKQGEVEEARAKYQEVLKKLYLSEWAKRGVRQCEAAAKGDRGAAESAVAPKPKAGAPVAAGKPKAGAAAPKAAGDGALPPAPAGGKGKAALPPAEGGKGLPVGPIAGVVLILGVGLVVYKRRAGRASEVPSIAFGPGVGQEGASAPDPARVSAVTVVPIPAPAAPAAPPDEPASFDLSALQSAPEAAAPVQAPGATPFPFALDAAPAEALAEAPEAPAPAEAEPVAPTMPFGSTADEEVPPVVAAAPFAPEVPEVAEPAPTAAESSGETPAPPQFSPFGASPAEDGPADAAAPFGLPAEDAPATPFGVAPVEEIPPAPIGVVSEEEPSAPFGPLVEASAPAAADAAMAPFGLPVDDEIPSVPPGGDAPASVLGEPAEEEPSGLTPFGVFEEEVPAAPQAAAPAAEPEALAPFAPFEREGAAPAPSDAPQGGVGPAARGAAAALAQAWWQSSGRGADTCEVCGAVLTRGQGYHLQSAQMLASARYMQFASQMGTMLGLDEAAAREQAEERVKEHSEPWHVCEECLNQHFGA